MTDQTPITEPIFWPNDALGRDVDGGFLRGFLISRIGERAASGRKRSYVLNVDGQWGRGKSYFLDGLAKYLRHEQHPVAQINAWRDDFASDALVPVMAAIEDALEAHQEKRTLKAEAKSFRDKGAALVAALGKGVLNTAVQKYVGASIGDLMGTLVGDGNSHTAIASESFEAGIGAVFDQADALMTAEAEREVSGFRATRNSIDDFIVALEALVARAEKDGKQMPMFILVDELDRCRPTYAIELLERVKHLFAADNVVFIFGTNALELSHSIRAVYGSDFDGQRYLYRFFDRTYSLPTPSVGQFVEMELARLPIIETKLVLPPNVSLHDYITYVFDAFSVDLRGVEQCLDLFRSVVTMWTQKVPLLPTLMLPMIVSDYFKVPFPTGLNDERPLTQKMSRRIKSPISFVLNNGGLTSSVNVMELTQSHLQAAYASRDAAREAENGGAMNGWTHSLRLNEFSQRHGGRSLALDYPSFIATAGRLSG